MNKHTKVKVDPVVRRNTAVLLAVATFLGGLFLGFNISFFINAERQTTHPVPAMEHAAQAPAAVGPDLQQLEKQAQANDQEPHAWFDLGNAYYDTGQAAKAIEAYQRGLALAPDHADVWTDLGVMYRQTQQPEKAVQSFDRAIQEQPGHQTALFNKGIVLFFDLDDRDGAVAAWESLLRINPQAQTPDGKPLRDLVERIKAGEAM